jgi:hypothetical protein
LVVKLLEDVRHNGELYKSGQVVDVFSDKEEERLIKLKSAETLPEVINHNFDEEIISPEEFKELYDRLDKAATKEPLIEAALRAGVELSEDDQKTKKKIIEEIIAQSMEQEVLAELGIGE